MAGGAAFAAAFGPHGPSWRLVARPAYALGRNGVMGFAPATTVVRTHEPRTNKGIGTASNLPAAKDECPEVGIIEDFGENRTVTSLCPVRTYAYFRRFALQGACPILCWS